jgi:hypothetical protein
MRGVYGVCVWVVAMCIHAHTHTHTHYSLTCRMLRSPTCSRTHTHTHHNSSTPNSPHTHALPTPAPHHTTPHTSHTHIDWHTHTHAYSLVEGMTARVLLRTTSTFLTFTRHAAVLGVVLGIANPLVCLNSNERMVITTNTTHTTTPKQNGESELCLNAETTAVSF